MSKKDKLYQAAQDIAVVAINSDLQAETKADMLELAADVQRMATWVKDE